MDQLEAPSPSPPTEHRRLGWNGQRRRGLADSDVRGAPCGPARARAAPDEFRRHRMIGGRPRPPAGIHPAGWALGGPGGIRPPAAAWVTASLASRPASRSQAARGRRWHGTGTGTVQSRRAGFKVPTRLGLGLGVSPGERPGAFEGSAIRLRVKVLTGGRAKHIPPAARDSDGPRWQLKLERPGRPATSEPPGDVASPALQECQRSSPRVKPRQGAKFRYTKTSI